ncbi:hypothetical protein [Taibaiella soli]|uniref:DUF2846 domain-containing protein n=1 Tax=Taibaiella soli TaxID=1649169 RepID=A0A2W2B7S5_9BACT|nr:hypothetical protein [Taibaiella soli]PZF72319.1 hypothetical protein DN068_13255 [Taibaiella soli]
MNFIKQCLPALIGGFLFTSCASTYQVVPVASDNVAQASISVYRKNILDFLYGVKIYSNDTFIGKIGSKRYIKWAVNEGHYDIKAKCFGKAHYSLDVHAAENYQLVVAKTVGPALILKVKLKPAKNTMDLQAVNPPHVKGRG